MNNIPTPDIPFGPEKTVTLTATNVTIRTVGLLPPRNLAEILATDSEGRWLRFYLKRTSRVVRLFYKGCGVTKGPGWLDGVVEHKSGIGNYILEATHIGMDKIDDEETLVLEGVTLREG